MKFKIFTALKHVEVESQVNDWLSKNNVAVRTSGSSMMQIPGPFASVPTFMVTVFYDEL